MLIDITRPIHPEMAIYPGNPLVTFTQVAVADESAGVSGLTEVCLGSHTGTHMDAPGHIRFGEPGARVYDLEQLCGAVEVVEVGAESVIGVVDLPTTTMERVLFKTRNSEGDMNMFNEKFVALDESAAAELVARGVRLVGIDGLSIKKKGVKDKVHAILLDAGVAIVEGLWLAEVEVGPYELLCLPLKVDLDGAPVRAVLRK